MIRCVHAFLPMLKKSKGRIVSVASVAGRTAFPCGAPYHIAKYGVEAYMESIRFEVEPYGIGCSILEPGAFKTNLLNPQDMWNRVNSRWEKLSPEIQEDYGVEFKDRFVSRWNTILMRYASSSYHFVVDNYFHAITAKYPRLRYRCGWDAILLFIPMAFMPAILYDFIFKLLTMKDSPIPASMNKSNSKKTNKSD